MIRDLITDEVLRFITEHESENVEKVLFKYHNSNLPITFIADQIKGRQKYKSKLPNLVREGWLFPRLLAGEQASSEITAEHKSKLFNGQSALDLTGGLGVDSLFLSRTFDNVTYVEADAGLCEFASLNYETFAAPNIDIINLRAEEFLGKSSENYELIYVDPDRRSDGVRAVSITESSPNISKLLPTIKSRAKNWMFKLSPMLDIDQVLKDLPGAGEIHLISVENDLKELLIISRGDSKNPTIVCADYLKGMKRELRIPLNDIKTVQPDIGILSEYLYEPSVTLMKASGFGYLGREYDLKQLDKNTHLFTGNRLIADFPGKKFRIVDKISPSKKAFKESLGSNGATISTRNFPGSPERLRSKYKIPEGNGLHVFFTKTSDSGYVSLITEPLRLDNQS